MEIIKTKEIIWNKKELGKVEFFKAENGRFVLRGFTGRRRKSTFFYSYSTEDQRQAKALSFEKRLIEHEVNKANRRKEQQERTKAFRAQLKKGVILCDSWGYEQTNVEFYEVLDVQGANVTLRELGHVQETNEGGSSMSCYVTPNFGQYIAGPIVKKVLTDHVKICSSISLTIWDGRKMYKSWYY